MIIYRELRYLFKYVGYENCAVFSRTGLLCVGARDEEGGESKKIQTESKWIRPLSSENLTP